MKATLERGLAGAMLRAALGIVLLLFACAARAQIPGLPGGAQKAAETVAAESPEQLQQRLAGQLKEARSQRDRLSADPAALVGLGPAELTAARASLNRWVLALEGQLRVQDELKAAREALRAAQQTERDWKGFADPPPYSILLVDDLGETVESIRTKLSALAAQRVIAGREAERLLDRARSSQAALRQAREEADVAGPSATPGQQARARVASWTAEADAAEAAAIERSVELAEQQAAVERERLTLAERKLETASRDARFTAEDLERVRKGDLERQARIRAQRAKAGEDIDRQGRELAAAAAALSSLESNPATPAEELAIARARARAAQAAVDTSRFEIDMLDSLAAFAGVGVELFSLRQQALVGADAEQRRDAVAKLRAAGARLAPWREYAQSQLDLLRAGLSESGVRAGSQDEPPQVQAYEQAIGESLRRRLAAAQRLFDAASRADRTLARWLVGIDRAHEGRPLAVRLADGWAATRGFVRSAWNFELFAVEDTVEVAGQKITTAHGVTVGKSVGALLLFVIGYWLAARLARRFEGVLSARFAVDPAQARTVRRWVMALWAFVLLVTTLNLAHIPLTVFAFLGGALAIGVGFGTQTIIRNVISGLIVLMERQVRVGDTIEVDGVTGTVTEVNLRSSTVRGFDGVEAIIPNANLLENKVTNWTHTDRRLRRVIRVGVAYGSPVRQVGDLLLECLRRHGHVLKDPEPLVLFEDFGDSALVFAMYFWLEMKPGVSTLVVMSDLRHMVHKSLDEAGIVIPFPQRDVHLDTARPLRVEVLRGDGTAAG
jgi:small-conductance mechanosensitive channel